MNFYDYTTDNRFIPKFSDNRTQGVLLPPCPYFVKLSDRLGFKICKQAKVYTKIIEHFYFNVILEIKQCGFYPVFPICQAFYYYHEMHID